jgi:hypothetical protein
MIMCELQVINGTSLICDNMLANRDCLSQVEAAQERCLRSGVTAPDLAAVKNFLHFYIATSPPGLTEKLTVDSINTIAE